MRSEIGLALSVWLVCVGPCSAQSIAQLAREAQIRAAVPYAAMLAQDPGLTIQQYNAAVRELAERNGVPLPSMIPPMSISPPSATSSTINAIGPFSFYSDSNGVTGNSTRIGSFTYYGDSTGLTGNASHIGPFTYYNFSNGVIGNTSRIGPFTYHNFSDGVTGSSQQIG